MTSAPLIRRQDRARCGFTWSTRSEPAAGSAMSRSSQQSPRLVPAKQARPPARRHHRAGWRCRDGHRGAARDWRLDRATPEATGAVSLCTLLLGSRGREPRLRDRQGAGENTGEYRGSRPRRPCGRDPPRRRRSRHRGMDRPRRRLRRDGEPHVVVVEHERLRRDLGARLRGGFHGGCGHARMQRAATRTPRLGRACALGGSRRGAETDAPTVRELQRRRVVGRGDGGLRRQVLSPDVKDRAMPFGSSVSSQVVYSLVRSCQY